MGHAHHTGFRRIWWFPPLPTGARVFEIGAGEGAFAEACRARGWVHTGCEPKTGTPPIEKWVWDPTRYDAVFAWQVIEHLDDPLTVLREARQHVRHGAWLCVSTPNMTSVECWLLGERWEGWAPGKHRTHFTARSLAGTISAAGFRVEHVLHQRITKHLPGGVVTGTLLAALHLSSRVTTVARAA